jgi:hypothetical protein
LLHRRYRCLADLHVQQPGNFPGLKFPEKRAARITERRRPPAPERKSVRTQAPILSSLGPRQALPYRPDRGERTKRGA